MRSKLTILTLTILLAVPTLVLAQGGHGRWHGHGHGTDHDPGFRMERMFEHLDLDQAQREQLEQAFDRHRDANQARVESLRTARRALADQIHAETFDEAAIRQAAAELATVEADLAVERATMFQEIRRVLTPEQLEKFKEMHEQRKERMEQGPGAGRRFGHHGPRGGGGF